MILVIEVIYNHHNRFVVLFSTGSCSLQRSSSLYRCQFTRALSFCINWTSTFSEDRTATRYMLIYSIYHLPPGFLSLRKEEPLPELFPKTPVPSYSWPRRTQVADKVVSPVIVSPSCFRYSIGESFNLPAALSILVVSTLSLF